MKNTYIGIGTISALALLMSGLPVVAFAESDVSADVNVEIRTQDQDSRSEAKSPNRQSVNDDDKLKDDDNGDQDQLEIELEDDEDSAVSLDDLKLKIESRKKELKDEEERATPKFKSEIKNANEVRLAVHALLASRDLLGGGIGQQVSEIAKHMNDSVASTTDVEVKIKSRSFIAKIFFGGDKKAAEMISDAVERNQENIAKLTELLNKTNLSADVKLVLSAQISALEEAQVRLQALAEKERDAWGIFSWRF